MVVALISILTILWIAGLAPPAAAVTPGAASGSSQVEVPRPPLSPLPKAPRLELPPPTAEQLHLLDAWLDHFRSKDPAERDSAIRQTLEASSDFLPAIDRRLTNIAEGGDHAGMKRVLLDIRDKARDAVRAKARASGDKGVETPDYLQMLSDYAEPESTEWKNAISVVALSRMLREIGTVQAARELVTIYVRFGEFLRVDTQLQLDKMGDHALAALIEAQHHPAEKIARWAARQLDLRGKAIPGEAIRTDDYEILADVLRAYGRIRDPDAARLVVSFANSERTQIRDAARQSVALMGEVAEWQLRDTYENVVGKKPPREWSWERTARELFTEFDRLRLSQVYLLYEKGLKAQQAGDLKTMAESFDQVLAQNPSFEHGAEMVAGYVAYARAIMDSDRSKASAVLHRAHRLASDDVTRKPIESLILTLEAEDLLDKGIADQVLLRRAIDLDSTNGRAQTVLDRILRGDVARQSAFNRYVGAGAIGVLALVALAIIGLRKPKTTTSTDDDTQQVAAEKKG